MWLVVPWKLCNLHDCFMPADFLSFQGAPDC